MRRSVLYHKGGHGLAGGKPRTIKGMPIEARVDDHALGLHGGQFSKELAVSRVAARHGQATAQQRMAGQP